MPRFRLRYQSTNLEMPIGEFAIGRSSSCSLALADGLVSRRHAVLHVSPEAVVVEDLGSRNGVGVNGVRINGPRKLAHMDRVYIGSQELVLIDADMLREGPKETAGYIVCEACGAINGVAKRRCGECGKLLASDASDTLSGESRTRESEHSSSHAWGSEETRQAKALDVIGGIASKAIAMGRFEEAERMLTPHMEDILQRAQRTGTLSDPEQDDPDALFRGAIEFALKLAQGLREPRWIDWVFRVHSATHRLMEAPTIEMLHNLVRTTRYSKSNHLRSYLRTIHGQCGEYTPAQRFLVRRLEGLEQVVSAH